MKKAPGNVLFPNPGDSQVESLEELYARRCLTPHNIDKHLPLLRHLGSQCETITEFGSDIGFSTTAFLAARPKVLRCVDVCIRQELLTEVLCWAPKGTKVELIEDSTLEIDPIPLTDLLLVDTLHTYEQVKGELEIHGGQVSRFICLHDIVSFPCIVPAIREWLAEHPEWLVREWSLLQCGMVVLERQEIKAVASHTEGTEPELDTPIPYSVTDLGWRAT